MRIAPVRVRALLACVVAAYFVLAGQTPAFASLPRSTPILPLAMASPGASEGGDVPAGATSPHGWFIAPAGSGFDAAIMHLPPRDGRLSTDGTIKLANVLTEQPVGLIGDGARVLVILASSRGQAAKPGDPPSRVRRVVSLGASKTVGGSWEYKPSGRLRVEPELPGYGQIVDTCWSPGGPLVLLAPNGANPAPSVLPDLAPEEAAGSKGWSLFRLGRERWEPVALPNAIVNRLDALGVPAAALRLESRSDRAVLWLSDELGGGPALSWDVPTENQDRPAAVIERPRPPGGLTRTELLCIDGVTVAARCRPGAENASPPSPARTSGVEPGKGNGAVSERATGAVAATSKAGGERIAVYSMAGGVWRPLTEVQPAADAKEGNSAVLGLAGLGRIAFITPDLPAGDRAASDRVAPDRGGGGPRSDVRSIGQAALRGFSIVEIAVADGREVFRGPAKRDGPVTTREFHLLTLGFGAMLIAVLVFVMRSEQSQRVVLPEGASLAGPIRRTIAWVVDLGLAVFLAGPLFGMKPSELISVQTLLGAGGGLGSGLGVIIGVLALGAACGTIAEWVWGCSLGKLLTGCEVVGFRKQVEGQPIDEGAERVGGFVVSRPTITQALVRNAVKWLCWPLTLVAVFDPNGRHPGDGLAQTAVVVREEPVEDEEEM